MDRVRFEVPGAVRRSAPLEARSEAMLVKARQLARRQVL
jgi:hypothetical protein